jgi:hypothetical protein
MAAGLLKKNAAWSDYLADYRTALEYDRFQYYASISRW